MTETSGQTPIQELAEQTGAGSVIVQRWLGCWIDMLVLLAIIFAPGMIVAGVLHQNDAATTTLALGVAAGVLYFPVFETVWGRSIGKFVAGLKVVDKNGRTPNIGRVLVRTVFRLIEVNPLLVGGVPAGICVLCTKRKQRLGDLAAGTYVLNANSIRQALDVQDTLAALRALS